MTEGRRRRVELLDEQGAIRNRFPRQCAETRKVRRGNEVGKRKEETRRDERLSQVCLRTCLLTHTGTQGVVSFLVTEGILQRDEIR